MKNSYRYAGQSAILLCAILWSTSGLFIRLMDWDPAVIVGTRSFLAVLLLLSIRLKQGNLKEILSHITNGFWYAATMILFVYANKLTFAANSILLQYTAPIWACLLAWFYLKEKPHWEHWIALCLVCFGMLLVFGDGLTGGSLLGDSLSLISGITFAVSSVMIRKHKEGNPLDIMICAHLLTVLYSIPFLFIYPPQLNTANVLSVLYMGIFQIGLASILYVYGMKRVRTVQAMLTAAIEPVLNPVWVLLVLGEMPAISVIGGGVIIITAITFSSLVTRQREVNIEKVSKSESQ